MKFDWDKSAKLNNCTVGWLKAYFGKYPGSGKKVWWICEGDCGKEGVRRFSDCHDFCNKCSHNTSESRAENSARRIQYFIDKPEAGEAHSDQLIEYYKDPEVLKCCSDRTIQYHIDNPNAGKEHSDRLKDSGAMQIAIENQRGGNDIVNHHWLYDDSDLSKYTMPMTRSEHTRMHNYMREDGYEVPHINSKTDDNGLWGYH